MLRVWRISKGRWSACARWRTHHSWRAGTNPFSAAFSAAVGLLEWRIRGW